MAGKFGEGFSGLVELPIVSGEVTVGNALDIMAAAKRSAVIVNDGRFNYLHTANSVLGAPHAIRSGDQLHAVLSLMDAPYLPMIGTLPRERWTDLRPNFNALLRHGVIDAIPQGRIRIGGLITESDNSIGKLLVSRRFSVKDLTLIVTKCTCRDGHSSLPSQLIKGKCPDDGYDVVCK
jgi:hypothetical protein